MAKSAENTERNANFIREARLKQPFMGSWMKLNLMKHSYNTRTSMSKYTGVTSLRKPVFGDYGANWQQLASEAKVERICAVCGGKGSFVNPLHAHHVLPLSKGGSNSLSNLKVLCKQCHSAEHGHMQTKRR